MKSIKFSSSKIFLEKFPKELATHNFEGSSYSFLSKKIRKINL